MIATLDKFDENFQTRLQNYNFYCTKELLGLELRGQLHLVVFKN